VIGAGERAAIVHAVQRAIADACESGGGSAAVDAALARLGWRALLDDEPDDAIAIVFHELGRANATATALDDVLASALGETPQAELAVVLPAFASWQPPGRVVAGAIAADGLTTERVGSALELIVVCGTAEEPRLARVPAAALVVEEVRGLDPAARMRRVRVQGRTSSTDRLDPIAWPSAVALGRRALAHQIEGACRTMLDLARTHALTRAQFGRPVARFQAVRHRLAEALVAVEALAAALDAAREQPSTETAALAKASAGRTAATVVRHCQQVLAGIGFTTEHPFHRFAKRVAVLEGLLGSADRIVIDVGRRLLAERRVPNLIEL
jgi:hypothetical protein